MKALITGGAGFIGSHLAETLLKNDDTVTIVDDLSAGRRENFEHLQRHPKFHFVIETMMNETVMDRLIGECDIIYHLASAVGVEMIVSRPVEVIERCVLGTENVLRIANRYKRKVLLTSTSEVYGKNGNVPFREDDDRLLGSTTKSRWSYSCSKAIDEFLALAYHKEKELPVIIARLFNTVGPRQSSQYGMVLPRFIQQAIANEPITVYGDGSQTRCFCYVDDVVRALIDLMQHRKAVGQIFNVGSTDEISIMELAQRVKERTGSQSKIVMIPYDEAYERGFEDMTRRVPDLTKIEQLIDFKAKVELDTMIDRIHRYIRERSQTSRSNSRKHISITQDATS